VAGGEGPRPGTSFAPASPRGWVDSMEGDRRALGQQLLSTRGNREKLVQGPGRGVAAGRGLGPRTIVDSRGRTSAGVNFGYMAGDPSPQGARNGPRWVHRRSRRGAVLAGSAAAHDQPIHPRCDEEPSPSTSAMPVNCDWHGPFPEERRKFPQRVRSLRRGDRQTPRRVTSGGGGAREERTCRRGYDVQIQAKAVA